MYNNYVTTKSHYDKRYFDTERVTNRQMLKESIFFKAVLFFDLFMQVLTYWLLDGIKWEAINQLESG